MRHDHRNSPNTVALHDINQTHLIQQIIRFMQMDASQTGGISINEREQLIRGCCHGFSLVYSYMFAIGKLDWWLDCLQVLSTWTGSNDELNQVVHLSGANNKNGETQRQIITRIIHYVRFHQVTSSMIPEFNHMKQVKLTDQRTELGAIRFESDSHQNTLQQLASGYFTRKDLTDLLQEQLFNIPCMLLASVHQNLKSSAHSVSIMFDRSTNQWMLYDSNAHQGAIAFNHKSKLCDHLISNYTANIQLQYIALDNNAIAHSQQQQFAKTYQQICRNNPLTLPKTYGYVTDAHQNEIQAVSKSIVEQLIATDITKSRKIRERLLAKNSLGDTELMQALSMNKHFYLDMRSLAIEHGAVRYVILKSLFHINHEGISGYNKLSRTQSVELASQLLDDCLLCSEQPFDQATVTLFESIFNTSNVDRWRNSSLLFSHPSLLGYLFNMSAYSQSINDAFKALLLGKNRDELTGLEHLISQSPEQLKNLTQHCRNNVELSSLLATCFHMHSKLGTPVKQHPFTDQQLQSIYPCVSNNHLLSAGLLNYYQRVQGSVAAVEPAAHELMSRIKVTAVKNRAFKRQLIASCIKPLIPILQRHVGESYSSRYALEILNSDNLINTDQIRQLLDHSPLCQSYRNFLETLDDLIMQVTSGSKKDHALILKKLQLDFKQLKHQNKQNTLPIVSIFNRQSINFTTEIIKKTEQLISEYQQGKDLSASAQSETTETRNPMYRAFIGIAISIGEWLESIKLALFL